MAKADKSPQEQPAPPAGKLAAEPAVQRAGKDRPAQEPEGRVLDGKVVNAPTAQTKNNGGFETKVVVPANAPADKTAGANAAMAANAFEQRVTQEQGTH